MQCIAPTLQAVFVGASGWDAVVWGSVGMNTPDPFYGSIFKSYFKNRVKVFPKSLDSCFG